MVQVGHAPRTAAIGRHQVDFGHPLFAPDKSQPCTVGGERRVVDLAQIAGQPPRHAPEIIFGNKYNRVLVNGGEPVIAVAHAILLRAEESDGAMRRVDKYVKVKAVYSGWKEPQNRQDEQEL